MFTAALSIACDITINSGSSSGETGSIHESSDDSGTVDEEGETGVASTSSGTTTGPAADDGTAETTAQDGGSGEEQAGQLVFLSGIDYLGGGLRGPAGADALCQLEADAAGFPGTFRAWVSDGQNDAIDRITGPGPWVDLSGEVVFQNATGLQVAPSVPIAVQPSGQSVSDVDDVAVWTGTRLGGTADLATCTGWLGQVGDGTIGRPVGNDSDWTESGDDSCQAFHRLYCFEVLTGR